MPHISELQQSNYMSKADVGQGKLLTISRIEEKNIARDDEPADIQWVMYFHEPDSKPFILKRTNQQLVAIATGSEYTEQWIGKQIVLYVDPTVAMKGKIVGGIRVRAPRNRPASAPTPVSAPPVQAPLPGPLPGDDEGVPF